MKTASKPHSRCGTGGKIASRYTRGTLVFAENAGNTGSVPNFKHPCFDEMRATATGYRVVGDLAVTDQIMLDTFWLGVYPGMNEKMLSHVIATIHGFVEKRR